MHIISLGAGVQSSTMALMAAAGEITPMPDCAIFADTQSEPEAVYAWLSWLEKQLPFPVHRVTAGSLRDEIMSATSGSGRRRMNARPPFFTSPNGMLRRQCTQDYKIRPIERLVRDAIGLTPKQRWPKSPVVEQWIGISLDEVQRARTSRRPAITHRWPLIEKQMTRQDCLSWMLSKSYPRPPKSACTFCPYHDDAMWRDMKINDPTSFADAVIIDRSIRNGVHEVRPKSKWYLHRDRVPLEEVDFRSAAEAGQNEMFDEHGFAIECEGMCGV